MSEVLWLDPHQIEPNPWNPNVVDDLTRSRIRESIKRFGFVDPVTVRHLTEGRYQIIDGEHRWEEAKALDLTEIPAMVVSDIDDDMAKQLTLALNELHGAPDRERLFAVLADLQQRHTAERLGQVLPFDRRTFDLAAGKLKADWKAVESKQVSFSTSGWVERVYRMPQDAAAKVDEAVAAARLEVEGDEPWRALVRVAEGFLEG